MEVGSIGGDSLVAGTLGLKQAQFVEQVCVTVLKKGLDLQSELAAQIFQSMGIGQNVDVKA